MGKEEVSFRRIRTSATVIRSLKSRKTEIYFPKSSYRRDELRKYSARVARNI
jgi:hypothetical protein